MIRNGKDIANGTMISTQICVIGSGPAGITMAWHLQKAGHQVTLIEGSRDWKNEGWEASRPDKILLYNGVADGIFTTLEPDFLILPTGRHAEIASERERVFGGTSAHWAGQCRALDAVTFREREGFPKWPINRDDLDPYYAKAVALCELDPDFRPEHWAEILGADVPHLAGFDTEMYQFVKNENLNFAERTFDGITIADSKADVILNASLLDIDHSQGVVRSLRVASMDDDRPLPKPATEFTIRADAFVLACGAVANARQLLLSNAGNESGHVGRYFMGHPITTVPVITITKKFLTPKQMHLMIGDHWSVTGRFSPHADQQIKLGIGSCWFSGESGGYYFELAPNPDSRVTLADTRDPVFHQRQTRITWELTPRDKLTYEETTRLFKEAVNRLGGDVTFEPWETVCKHLVVNGHHIGTTRMSADPREGVVDANLKVHSLNNLYVAGSSVFPSAGVSNPTFTIVALAIRLAEHLSEMLGRQPA